MSTAMKKQFSKATKVSHPNSRKSIAITKRARKISNRQKAKMGGLIKQTLIAEKMLWIQAHMDQNVCPYTFELTADLLETYIERNDGELEQIAIKHSVGGKRIRQHASREDAIRMTKETEQEEYRTCGIEIPDILNPSQCQMLQKWNGELRLLPNFKFRRFGSEHLNKVKRNLNKLPKECRNKAQAEVSNKTEEISKDSEYKLTIPMENIETDKCTMETE